jgi:hypothetical protein
VTTPSTTYRLRNWRDYNTSLTRRGSLTLWIEEGEDLADLWLSTDKSGKPGASRLYSDKAVEICLSLRVLFRLPLRQSEGFVRSLLALAGLSLPVPDYSTLQRRQSNLDVSLPVRPPSGPRHVVIDSTGLKIYGEGEWKVRTHGKSGRRKWKKIHLAVDEKSGEVLSLQVSDGSQADGPLLPELVKQSQRTGGAIGQVSADGAYDSWENDAFLTGQGIVSTIPPRQGSRIRQHGNCKQAPPLQRDENLRGIRRSGRQCWAKESGYTRRALAETHMMRQKRILGASLASRSDANQEVECRLRCAILNRLTHLGMPDSYPHSYSYRLYPRAQ